MDTFYIIPNQMKESCVAYAEKIRDYLQKKGKICRVQVPGNAGEGQRHFYTDTSQIPFDTEVVLVLGGDGTLLQASRDLVDLDLPLLGVNMGTLGYLAEIEAPGVFDALDRLMAGEYYLEERMMLRGSVRRAEKPLLQDLALNDIVISRRGHLRVVDFHIYVDRTFLCSYRADGIIFSTPTGSTGYSLSAGGPIVSPKAKLMLMTPVAPHTLNSRPIVLPDDVEVTLKVGGESAAGEGMAGRDMNGGECAEVVFDGDTTMPLQAGDTIVVGKSSRMTHLARINHTSFVEILRSKMN